MTHPSSKVSLSYQNEQINEPINQAPPTHGPHPSSSKFSLSSITLELVNEPIRLPQLINDTPLLQGLVELEKNLSNQSMHVSDSPNA